MPLTVAPAGAHLDPRARLRVALFDQWRERRGGFQLIWAFGMLFYGVAAGCEAIAGASGWNEALYRTWYLTGAVWTAGWLGLGTAFLLGRTRFGYSFALCLFLAGLFTFLVRNRPEYPGAGSLPLLYFIVGRRPRPRGRGRDVLPERALADARGRGRRRGDGPEHRPDGRRPTLPAPGYAVDPTTGVPVATLFPPQLRLLTPFLNITGAFALILGAVFSTYVFMPKRRVLPYSLDPNQPGDEFLFNLLIAPVAITVNLVASLPGAIARPGHRPDPQPRAGDDPHRDRRVHPDADRQPQPVRRRRSSSSSASSSASSSCSPASSSRSRSSARSGSRSPRSCSAVRATSRRRPDELAAANEAAGLIGRGHAAG